MRSVRPVQFFLLFLLPAIAELFTVNATSQSLSMRSLSVNEGLPQGQVRGLVQDKKGFMWIASEGLSRYDGRQFYNLSNVYGDKASLSDDLIMKLSIDDEDDLWAVYGTRAVDIIHAPTGRVRHLTQEPAFRWLKENPELSRIRIRQAGGRYFAANGLALYAFDKNTGHHQKISIPAGEYLVALGSGNPHQVVVSTTKGLYELSGNALQKIAVLPPVPDVLHTGPVIAVRGTALTVGSIRAFEGGRKLVMTAVGGVFVYNRQTGRTVFHGGKDDRIPEDIAMGQDGSFYYLLSKGLFCLVPGHDPILIVPNTDTLQLNTLLVADRSGNLWAGAEIEGLRITSLKPASFSSFKVRQSFGSDVLKTVVSNPPANLFFESYSLRSAKDSRGRLFVQAHSGTLQADGFRRTGVTASIYEWTTNGLRLRQASEDGLEKVYLAIDRSNHWWQVIFNLRTLKRWLVRESGGQLRPFVLLPDGWTENGSLTAVGSCIAYLTDHQLRLYDTADARRCRVFSREALGVGGLLLMAVTDPADNNVLWIGTKGSGIVRLDVHTGAVRRYTTTQGLPNNTVYMMAPDRRGFFWCSSNKGLFRFAPRDGSVVAFTVKDGLQGNEFNRYHFLETPDGHFWFGGTEGNTVFHPDSIFLDSYRPPVAITDLRVNNVALQQLGDEWRDSLPSLVQDIRLTHTQNQLSFRFAGLQYDAPEKLQYRYRLEGLDEQWNYGGYDAGASYAGLPPGRYRLVVGVTNTAGRWSDKTATLSITILPPWWRTWWMYIIYSLVIATAIWLFLRSRLRRQALRQEVVLQKREAEQAQALEETKSRFFANITHELRTPLTLILSPVQHQLKSAPATYSPRLLQSVHQNAQTLLRLINQLLDMSKLEGGRMELVLHRGHPAAFIDSLLPPFQRQAEARQIDLQFRHDAAENEREYLFDSDKLEKVVHNLVGNALKFTPAGGSVVVELEQIESDRTSSNFTIRVSDTGIGIGADQLPHIFDRFYQAGNAGTRRYEGTGIGLSLVRELVVLMGGTVTVESEPDRGTVFTLTLPMKVAATGDEPQAGVSHETTIAPQAIMPEGEQLQLSAPAVDGYADDEGSKPLVLVTEDNDELRRFISGALSAQYRVITATNGAEGLRLAETEIPDLIISDLMMPQMDGYEFCRRVKTSPLTSHIGFILLTARTAAESRVGGLREGADHYLSKPFVVEELLLVAGNLLRRQEQLRAFYHAKWHRPDPVAGPIEVLIPSENETAQPVAQEQDVFLNTVISIIDRYLNSDQLDVDFLANEMSVSRRTLNRKLSAVTGSSANELIRNHRLSKAAELLRQGESVKSAAFATGFSTPSWFSQCFKDAYGIAPVQYMQNHQVNGK